MAVSLYHGGIMANYQCNAACRHCLYACSPKRSGGYITKEVAEEVSNLLCEKGCRSVHIGGGEPFLSFDGLVTLLQVLTRSGITVEYVETNAFWVENEQLAKDYLCELGSVGAKTLCISVDPFHAEYVPVNRPLMLAKLCRSENFQFFLWQEKFLPLFSNFDANKALSRSQMEQLISPDYVLKTAHKYGLNIGGRAINIEMEFMENKPVEQLADSTPCQNLLSGNHFHIDLYGRFIPPGCTGIAIPLHDVTRGIPNSKYPVFEALLNGGVAELLSYARSEGFTENPEGYTSKCVLCFYIRKWLSEHAQCPELDAEHYAESLRFYD